MYNDELDCKYFWGIGYVPHTSHGDECCPTCHSTIIGLRWHTIIYKDKTYRVCCAMERAVTNITFEEQLERIMK